MKKHDKSEFIFLHPRHFLSEPDKPLVDKAVEKLVDARQPIPPDPGR